MQTLGNLRTSKATRKDAAQNRCRILEIAKRLFRECGAESVTMHQIAKDAGVGQGTLYRHYAHKGELCLDILQESIERFLADTEAWIEASSNRSRIEILDGILSRVIDLTDDHLHVLAVMANSFEGMHTQFENPLVKHLHQIIYTVLQTAIDNQEIAPLDVQFTTDSLLFTLSPAHYSYWRNTRGYSKAQIVSGLRRLHFDGLTLKPHS